MDPILTPVVSSILTFGTQRVQKHLDYAQAVDRSEVERVVGYLRAISEAVNALEIEADELLSQCEWMDRSDKDEVLGAIESLAIRVHDAFA